MYSNAKQHIPELFREIIRNDNERAELKASPVVNFEDWRALKEEREGYRRDAEKALQRSGDNHAPARR